ncbi:MAG: glycosyltransferase [Candidatus Omnitrophica bacterium]|nr:glycosyltransferase [Candidatus Omnitrophota bacterium]
MEGPLKLLTVSYFLIVTALFIYGLHGYFMVYLYRKNIGRHIPPAGKLNHYPPVTVQMPLYNEYYVIERLIDAVVNLKYPKDMLQIQVLDDSTDETKELVAGIVGKYQKEGFDIVQIHRAKRMGFKAGALRNGLESAKGEFVAIFDADFVPPADFLHKTLPYFEDKKTGLVQTRWGHLNSDFSFLTQTQSMMLDTHFVIEQTARNRSGCFMNFNGSAGIWRKECIIDAGNWQEDTLSEDIDISYRAQLKGWKFLYLKDVVSPAELPVQVNAFKLQQYRWTCGTLQCAKKLLLPVLRSKLSTVTKWLAVMHLTSYITYPLLLFWGLLSLPVVIHVEKYTVFMRLSHIMSVYILAFWSPFILIGYSQRELYTTWKEKLKHLPGLVIINFGLTLNNTLAVLSAALGIKFPFKRTPKFRIESKGDSWKGKSYSLRPDYMTILEFILGSYCLLTTILAFIKKDYALIPFLGLYTAGLLTVAFMGLFHSRAEEIIS